MTGRMMIRGVALAVVATAAGLTTEAMAQGYGAERAPGTVVEVAERAGSFTTLLAAVRAAGLEDALRGEGPFTVFAPTDEAFAALPDGTVESLLANPEALRAVLTYHVVSGKVTAEQVVTLNEAKTLQGAAVEIRAHDGAVHVGGATVTAADVMASNGVIHVIDRVLLPPTE